VKAAPGVHPAKARTIAANIAKLPELLRRSVRDAQLFLDVGHQRVRQARLAEVCKVISDGLPAIECLRTALRVAPDYADAMFNLALLLQRKNQYAEAAEHWRRYLASDCQSEWAARARRSLKFCEMQLHLVASA
jgi:tetratricopeptide (TPR) repeat protein